MTVDTPDEIQDMRGEACTPAHPPRPTVTVVIPALNEARNLPIVARQMPVGVDEVVLVDGHSMDDTVTVARGLWPDATILTQSRRGKGNALACGFRAATCDIVVMIDADGSTDPAEITTFVDALIGGADVAKGTRFAAGGGSSDITVTRRLGSRMLAALANRAARTSFSDLCYGYMAFWRCHLPVLALPDVGADGPQWGDGFEIETVIAMRVVTSGLRVVEVPSFERDRVYGESNLNAVSDGLRVLRTIWQERGRRPRRRPAAALFPEVRASVAGS